MLRFLNDIEFANPAFLWLLAGLPLLLAWRYGLSHWWHGRMKLSTVAGFEETGLSLRYLGRFSLPLLRVGALALMIVAMARPQSSWSWQDKITEGIDIVIALDISSSMLARDLRPNRLEASKAVALEFLEGRPNDRMGLVIYSAEAFTQCPVTTDHAVLHNLFEEVQNGMVTDGTAIGLGLATAINRLRHSDAKSKVVVLLTDGVNTTGKVSPLDAASIARLHDIRVYTIGVGTKGHAPYPFVDHRGREHVQQVEVKIDEETLREIAEETGGLYFRATDNDKLKVIYSEIDQMEKSKVEVTEYQQKNEEFFPLLVLAAFLLGLEYLLRQTVFRTIAEA